ncbi:MAG: response regulator transcription factor [Lachnospiraceae bacterium]|nr:response regulator transcription factor [Lachnospiraceae bacterium]
MEENMKLLIAEDEIELSNALAAILRHSGYTVDAVYNGKDALDYGLVGEYDGILLDVMMPAMDGMQVLEKLRAQGISTPALFLTAKSEVEDRIRGLDLGADDYLMKPFDMGELLARIRAMIRRRQDFTPARLTAGNLSLDRSSCSLASADGKTARLTAKEFQIMEMLMESPGRVISVDVFMDRIWPEGDTDTDIVWVNISNLRRKIKGLNASVEIRSTRGLGYSICEIQ